MRKKSSALPPFMAALGSQMSDRTTKELIEILEDDYRHFHEEIVKRIDEGEVDSDGLTSADFDFESRQLVRAAFAYFEAVTFSVKCTAANDCLEKAIPISDAERYFAVEVQYNLNDKGEVFERTAQIRLSQNIRFAFSLLARSKSVAEFFDPSAKWWSCFQKSVRVRDRLTHPRLPEDLDVSVEELLAVMQAKNGFDELLLRNIQDA